MGNICICNTCFNYYNNNNIEIYKLKGKYKCKVVDVYDGDTVTIVIFNRFQFEKYKLRMYGYDSPELKPKLNKKNRDIEIDNAKKAKQFLSDLVLNKILIFESFGFDKYGRLLGKLFTYKNIEINQLMIDNKFGYPYYGGTKI